MDKILIQSFFRYINTDASFKSNYLALQGDAYKLYKTDPNLSKLPESFVVDKIQKCCSQWLPKQPEESLLLLETVNDDYSDDDSSDDDDEENNDIDDDAEENNDIDDCDSTGNPNPNLAALGITLTPVSPFGTKMETPHFTIIY